MPTFSYLGTYVLSTNDDQNYTMEFYIPNNCNYRSTGSSGQFCISISLKPGQTQPSTNFVSNTENYISSRTGLTVEFDQPDQGGVKKPKIVVVC
ncbi:hypothetical protein [Flavobacterium selenitireducens]|uniref:hypothetical protein n=1 Tax=Flavobacterium selenitireducens TaxID=2722704 RepID=UPI00168B5525|nr:hypothetical protein [Flavobacterium selenitireducens]MBD3581437.1 hypothetical protein [Flavobacterium selenitireducens]